MSGPKMVGVTCDPEVIARNNERLRQIGKDNYYRGLFENINKDIENTVLWIQNYGNVTLNSIPIGYGDESGLLKEVKLLKEQYADKVEKKKFDLAIVASHSVEQLRKMGVQKVEDIPKWKEEFLSEMSYVLKKLQKDIDEFNSGIKQVKKENERVARASEEWMKKIEKEKEKSEKINVNSVRIGRYMGDEKDIPFMPEEGEYIDSETLPFTIEELALLEMLQADLEKYSKFHYLTDREKKLIYGLDQELTFINDTSERAYSMKSKRAVLQQMRMEYARLDKYVSMLVAAQNEQMEERTTLELEYISFCQALDVKRENYEEFSIQELRKRVNTLRNRVEKQESRIYIEESIENIMKGYGYSSISSYQLHDAESVSRIIFEDKKGEKISTSFGDGMIMMNVIGEGDNPPTDAEVKEMVRQQVAFCDLYPHIREQLLKKGIHINYENLMPVSAEQTSNEHIVRQKNIRKSTKRFSFRHVQLVSESKPERQFEDVNVQHLQYVDKEE
ncbi:hypothetical protein KQI69_00545 [Eubacterium sp. MSJ-13]|uniref:hypothetical protein n=1 Tax=Eubacterium sp. MSJ-13 TaxID=2841513 RepID=UPI001C120F5A|nr:hypothetical protein [Eubacterium sp. MSJ-13]MBU5477689.1 hypothetical protein [Eubacterium sp. MSJ-13]